MIERMLSRPRLIGPHLAEPNWGNAPVIFHKGTVHDAAGKARARCPAVLPQPLRPQPDPGMAGQGTPRRAGATGLAGEDPRPSAIDLPPAGSRAPFGTGRFRAEFKRGSALLPPCPMERGWGEGNMDPERR